LPEPNGVGVEVNDSSIPEYRSTLSVNWRADAFEAGGSIRYISSLTEDCGGAAGFSTCSNNTTNTNKLDAITYFDVRAAWHAPFAGLRVGAGINNVFD